MVCGTKRVLDGHWWWWQSCEEEEGDGDDGDIAGDDNYVDNDESESTAEMPASQGGTGPGICLQSIGGDPVTANRWGSGMQCEREPWWNLGNYLVFMRLCWPSDPKEFVAALSLVTW